MGSKLTRRLWLKQAGSVISALTLKGYIPLREVRQTIMVVSGWQDINIGDIAHTPGLLHVLNEFIPGAEIILWKKSYSEEVENLLTRNFPKLKIVYGNPDSNGNIASEKVLAAFSQSDILIHGSGPSVVGQSNIESWVKITGKPFGIFGTTIQNIDSTLAKLLLKASFIFTRETESLKVLDNNGIGGKNIFFVPDATFYMDIRNDEKASAFLMDHSLEERKFICVVPRLRRTPYYQERPRSYTPDQVKAIDDLNNSKKESDHAKMREAMIAWVRNTHNKVLVCPEMTYQVNIMDELLIDPLPDDVRPFVLKRGYWFPDEAASVYRRAFAVVSFECHSPIIAIANSTPAFYLRQPEDTIKGQMYYDLGLNDWIFEIEKASGSQISERLMGIVGDPKGVERTVRRVQSDVKKLFRQGTTLIK